MGFILRVINALGRKLNGGKPFSRKLVVQVLTNIVTWAVAFGVAKGLLHVPVVIAAYVPLLISYGVGLFAAWLVKEDPALFSASARK